MSNARQETIDDIVKEIRGNAEHNHSLVEVSKYLTEIADRIEAAQICGEIGEMVGREATCKESVTNCNQLGNAAAMREALIKVRSAICHFARYQCQSLSWENSNIQANCGDILCSWRDLCDAKTAINAALSAPPRNCDIMDWRTAWAKWRTECHPQKPCGYAEVVSGTEQFMDWYMSEAKGEAK